MRTALLLYVLAGTATAQNAVLTGIVTDSVSHRGIEGAQIQLGALDKGLHATTNVNGEFRVEEIPKGRTFIEITKQGYAWKWLHRC